MMDLSDLKRMQDGFVERSKEILLDRGHVEPVGFVVMLHRHLDELLDSGYGVEFLDPKTAFERDPGDDATAILVVDLSMSWKKLYHAVLTVFPETQEALPGLLDLSRKIGVDDPYARLMQTFLTAMQLDKKDIIAATMHQICDKTRAFASICQFEAWQRMAEAEERRDAIPRDLGKDAKSVEVLISSMETREFTRLVAVPIHRGRREKKQRRDSGKVEGFGHPSEIVDCPENNNISVKGRLVRFLTPLGALS